MPDQSPYSTPSPDIIVDALRPQTDLYRTVIEGLMALLRGNDSSPTLKLLFLLLIAIVVFFAATTTLAAIHALAEPSTISNTILYYILTDFALILLFIGAVIAFIVKSSPLEEYLRLNQSFQTVADWSDPKHRG